MGQPKTSTYNVGPTCHIFDRSQKLNWIPENKIYSVALQLKRDVMLPVCFNPNIFSTGMGKWGVLSIWCNTLLITYLIRTRPHLCGQSWTEGAASLCRLSPLSATKSLLPHISHCWAHFTHTILHTLKGDLLPVIFSSSYILPVNLLTSRCWHHHYLDPLHGWLNWNSPIRATRIFWRKVVPKNSTQYFAS